MDMSDGATIYQSCPRSQSQAEGLDPELLITMISVLRATLRDGGDGLPVSMQIDAQAQPESHLSAEATSLAESQLDACLRASV